jgi:hypothetical protein
MVADLAARRCDGREGVALLGAGAAGVAAVFGLLLEALIRSWRASRLAVKEIACYYVAWWRPALMEIEGEEDVAEGKASMLIVGFF